MPAPSDEVRPEEFRRGPAPGCVIQKMKESVAPMAALCSVAPGYQLPLVRSPTPRMLAHALIPRQSRTYRHHFLCRASPLVASNGPCTPLFGAAFGSAAPRSDRPVTGFRGQFASWIKPAFGQGEFSRTSTPAISRICLTCFLLYEDREFSVY